MSGPKPERPETLDAVREAVANSLIRGSRSAKHGFHTPVLITTDAEGAPDGRTVVLRAADPAAATLACHTDRRSPKLDHIRRNPSTCWVLYDAPRKIQVRAFGDATIHTDDDLADERWRASSLSSRRCYLAPSVPGQPADHPSANLPEHVRDRVPTEQESAAGRDHFAVIRAAIQRIDVLVLHRSGHIRAAFTIDRSNDDAAGEPVWLGRWLEP